MKNQQNMKDSKSHKIRNEENFTNNFQQKLMIGLIKSELKVFVLNGN